MIKWFILEIQTDADGNAAFLPPVLKETENAAWSAYYSTLSFAIMSSVFSHTVMLCTTDGRVLDSKNYVHYTPAPEVVTE